MGIFTKKFKDNKKYIERVDNNGIFDNRFSDALPQTTVADAVRKHWAQDNGKKKKAVIIGFDGARADSMVYIIKSNNSSVTGSNYTSKYSAVAELKKQGGLYMSFAGGIANDKKTMQETSTAQGWAAILTGKWGCENGVVKHVAKKNECPTVLMELARKGIETSFLAIWPDHFNITYKDEIALVEKENVPMLYEKLDNDEKLHSAFLRDIDSDRDCIFGIYELPDMNGHSFGFGDDDYKYVMSVCDLDRCAYELIKHIESRPTYQQEDWLIIITSDHGGHGRGHGTQMTEDRMTFIACNKKL